MAQLFPSYFAMVMATGIVGIDASTLGFRQIALALLAISIGGWLLFWLAGLMRAVREPRTLVRSLGRHETGPGFLTLVAGTGILGSEFAALQIATWVMVPLFALATALWWITQYGFLAGVSEGRPKPSLEQGLSGQWLLLVVATQSVASLGGDVLASAGGGTAGLSFVCYAWVLLGMVYYLLLGAVVLYRFAFVEMPPEDVSGPWWINEGSAAITVLAAGKLMTVPGLMIGGFALRSLLSPLTILFWADATFWIPLLALLFAWKHVVRRNLPGYSAALWSVVFPLGMYAAATLKLDTAYGLGFLRELGQIFFWIGLVAWAATFAGALVSAARALASRSA